MPPHIMDADKSGVTIKVLLICTRVIITHKMDAKRAEKPIPLTQFGAFHEAMSTPIRKMVRMVIGPEPPMKK